MGSTTSIVLVSTHTEHHKMWYEYEPLLTPPGRISSSPYKVPFPFPHFYPRYASNSHSGCLVYPSYQSYLCGMLDYDYQYEGHKQGPFASQYSQTTLSSLPFRINIRWTK